MIGHEGVVRAIVKLIKAKLPAVLQELETKQLDVPVGTIPRLQAVYPAWVDVVAKGQFPSLMVVQDDSETRNTGRQMGASGEFDEYEWTYPVNLVLHNVGADYGETELDRKRLMLALRMVLLRHRGLIAGEDEDATIVPETLRENFNGASIGESDKMLQESMIKLHVKTHETLTAEQGAGGPAEFNQSFGFMD